MFDSKFMILVIGILILCLAIVCYASLSDGAVEYENNFKVSSDDVGYIWMDDDGGSVKLTPVTDVYEEGSGSAPE